MSKSSANDAKRLRGANARLRVLLRPKDELLAGQKELLDLQAEQLGTQAKQIDAQAEMIKMQAEQIAVLELLVARQDEQVGEGVAEPCRAPTASPPR